MTKSPRVNPKLLARVAREGLADEAEQKAFEEFVQCQLPSHSVVLCMSERAEQSYPSVAHAFVDTLPSWVSIQEEGHRLGESELHASGDLYCFDLSSALEVASLCSPEVQKILPSAPFVLDLCSSPGGKAIFASRALRPSLLCCNEVIGKRHPALTSNLQRCRIPDAVVTSHDPEHFAKALAGTFHLVLVDAPCSGQSLVVKGYKSEGAFHEQTQKKNAMRQRRILANAAEALAPGGVLLYSTCTFSRSENEQNIDWLLRQKTELSALPIASLLEQQSRLTTTPCYRFWPHRGEGAGGFAAILQKNPSDQSDVKEVDEVLESLQVRWKSRN